MDKLFSDIQQSFQKPDKNTLLQNQQISQDKINELLNQASESLLCGPTCQKMKVGQELEQKYLDAQTNVKTAPIELERTKKNYYVFTEGRPFYDNMMEKELTKKAESISVLIGQNFSDELTSARTMNQYLNLALINSSHTEELLNHYKKENKKLTLMLKDNRSDILTNNRKTYYETEELERLKLWYKLWFRLFYLVFIAFLICCFVCESIIGRSAKIILAILIVFYPYYIDYVLRAVYNFFAGIRKNLPKNVYNNL